MFLLKVYLDEQVPEELRPGVFELKGTNDWAVSWIDDAKNSHYIYKSLWSRGSAGMNRRGVPNPSARFSVRIQELLGERGTGRLALPEYPGVDFTFVPSDAKVRLHFTAGQRDRGPIPVVDQRSSPGLPRYVCLVRKAGLSHPALFPAGGN